MPRPGPREYSLHGAAINHPLVRHEGTNTALMTITGVDERLQLRRANESRLQRRHHINLEVFEYPRRIAVMTPNADLFYHGQICSMGLLLEVSLRVINLCPA